MLERLVVSFWAYLPNPRIEPKSPSLQGDFFKNWAKWEDQIHVYVKLNYFAGHLKHNTVIQIYSNKKKKKKKPKKKKKKSTKKKKKMKKKNNITEKKKKKN